LDKLPPPLPSILWSWLIGKKERDGAMRREGARESVVCVCERKREKYGAMRHESARETAVCVCERERRRKRERERERETVQRDERA